MNKTVILISFVLSCIIGCVLITNQLYTFAIVVFAVCAILLACLIKAAAESKSPKSIYEKNLGEIIKTYEPILVDVEKIPNLEVKNIVIASSFEKMVDIQYELKKPILYKKSLNSSSFFLLDTEVVYIYTIKVDKDSFSPVDDIIASLEMQNKKRRKDKKILDDIDKTTIIKLDDFREFKVSPVRKRDASKIDEVNITFDDENTTKEENKPKEEKQSKVTEKAEITKVEKVVEEEQTEAEAILEENNVEIEEATEVPLEEQEEIIEEVVEETTKKQSVEEIVEDIDTEEAIETEETTLTEETVVEEPTPVVEESTKEENIQEPKQTRKKNHATERARKYRQQQKSKKQK